LVIQKLASSFGHLRIYYMKSKMTILSSVAMLPWELGLLPI